MTLLRSAVAALCALALFACPPQSGPSGPQGPQGSEGAAGPQGPQGSIGPQGPQGEVLIVDGGVLTGPRGAPGASVVLGAIAPGAECPAGGVRVALEDGGSPRAVCAGVPGAQGPAGPSGSTGAAGRDVRVEVLDGGACPTGGLRLTSADGGVAYLCHGAMGPQGAAGPQGAVGATGLQGPQGVAGPTGATGSQGAIGLTGPLGLTGAAGPQGPAGVAGPQGTVGPAGAVGATGAPGVAGAAGPQGPQGVAGPAGATGSAGAQGPMGPPGAPGPALLLDGGLLSVETPAEGHAFAGFTAATYDGNLGGFIGAQQKCAAEFTGAHLCTIREFTWAGVAGPLPAQGAWTDDSVSTGDFGIPSPRERSSSYTCNNWRSNNGPSQYMRQLTADGVLSAAGYDRCNVLRPLACCRSPHLAWFRGFTSLSYDGDLGGLSGANARCHAQFAGAHLCTMREYSWAGSPAQPGAQGAWVDDVDTADFARPRDRSSSYTCNNWRSNNGPSQYMRHLDAQGLITAAGYNHCNVARPLTCCGG